MAVYADRVKETTTTTGTGTITLAGAVTDFKTFNGPYATGDILTYVIDGGTGEWEVVTGVLASSTTLTRVRVLASSNSGSLVNFSAGTKNVFPTLSAEFAHQVLAVTGMTATMFLT